MKKIILFTSQRGPTTTMDVNLTAVHLETERILQGLQMKIFQKEFFIIGAL